MTNQASENAIIATFEASRRAAAEGQRTPIRLYRVARPSACGGYMALHPSGVWQWMVEGEWLTHDRQEAVRKAAEVAGLVQDTTRKYTGSVFD